MLDLIFSIKFIHVLAVTVMFGTWLGLALFMLLAHRSGNTSVVAVTSQFVVKIELMVVAAAVALQPISGFPLAYAIGLRPTQEFWIVISLFFYAVIVVLWLAAVRTEMRIRNLTRDAALKSAPLGPDYRRLFHIWSGLSLLIFAAMIAVYVFMIWQPRLGY